MHDGVVGVGRFRPMVSASRSGREAIAAWGQSRQGGEERDKVSGQSSAA